MANKFKQLNLLQLLEVYFTIKHKIKLQVYNKMLKSFRDVKSKTELQTVYIRLRSQK